MILEALSGMMMRGMSRETFVEADEREEAAEAGLIGGDQVFWLVLWLVLNLALLTIALVLASRCGGGLNQYVAAGLEPWVYILIRLATPCSSLNL